MFKTIVIFLLILFAGSAIAANDYRTSDGETLLDPTKPANWNVRKAPVKKSQEYQLNYILNSNERQQAIVNGKKVTVGDHVSGAKVLGISDSEVVLSVAGQRKVLRIKNKRQSFKK